MEGRPGPRDLWGKSRDGESGGPAWHPLVDHSTDVAGVLEAILRQPIVRHRLARAAGLDEVSEPLIARLCFLAFLHDIGKCAHGFRAKAVPELGPRSGHIEALKPLWLGGPLFVELECIFDEGEASWGSALCDYLEAVSAHHGRTPDLTYRTGPDFALRKGWEAQDREPLLRLRELVAQGRTLFGDAGGSAEPLPDAGRFQHLFAGLLMLADWLGSASETERFPFAEPGDQPRLGFVRERAPEVLRYIGFIAPGAPQPMPSFVDQFAFQPRSMQRAIEDVPLPDACGSILLLESETGSGKTEAAFRWASRLIDAGQVEGCFFAVPLRSAAVQLHKRMNSWLSKTYGVGAPEALLAVPGYYRMGKAEGHKLPEFAVQWSDDETSDRRRSRWAAEQPKRYAAASFAVGTIDQVLLGALAVKHAHLRTACLVRHLLVIDEVHASDIYMTTLSERLLELFRAAGGHVLLMAATVGSATRERLVAQRKRSVSFDEAVAVPYPRITASHTPPIDAQVNEEPKEVAIEPRRWLETAEPLAAHAAAAVQDGARVLILRNTVAAAMATQQAIEVLLPEGHPALFSAVGVVTLHHGRFAAEDRKILDEAVEARLGKSPPAAPALVVATQTLEQSLDVDADLLITDLCPVDVLLQRIGRLHRHRRDRPQDFVHARCIVLLPHSDDLAAFLERPRHGMGPERAYENVLAVEATRRLVLERPTWSIPKDNRLLVESATHEGSLKELAEQLGPMWRTSWQSYAGKSGAERLQAHDLSIDFAKPFGEVRWADAAERVATRLGARDILVPLERTVLSPFGTHLTHLKIPAWMAPEPMPEGEPVVLVDDTGTLKLGAARYRYDRFGLQRLSEGNA